MTVCRDFEAAVLAHLYAIDGLCRRWGTAYELTLILRDPQEPTRSLVFGAQRLEAVLQTLTALQAQGTRVP